MRFLNHLLSAHDIWFLTRAILTRPGDVPGIIRRGAARKRANLPTGRGADPDGLAVLIDSWEAAVAAGGFLAPSGSEEAAPDPKRLSETISILQTAKSVDWGRADVNRRLAALSLEAARLSVAQSAADPSSLFQERRRFVETTPVSPALRDALGRLAETPIGAS